MDGRTGRGGREAWCFLWTPFLLSTITSLQKKTEQSSVYSKLADFILFLINCWSSVVASVALPQLCNLQCPKVHSRKVFMLLSASPELPLHSHPSTFSYFFLEKKKVAREKKIGGSLRYVINPHLVGVVFLKNLVCISVDHPRVSSVIPSIFFFSPSCRETGVRERGEIWQRPQKDPPQILTARLIGISINEKSLLQALPKREKKGFPPFSSSPTFHRARFSRKKAHWV